ncbi:MAG TPA: hypothetical protein DEA05_04455 [Rhodobacteraceae bacterium]|nr:hypothetical protein [Paracoccaceae bacterium]
MSWIHLGRLSSFAGPLQVDRIIFLGGHPNLQTLDPLRIGETLRETLEADLAAEKEAVAMYTEAREYCLSVKDYGSAKLFEELIVDEEGHTDFLETQLALHDQIGAENYGLLNAQSADEADKG